MKRGALALLFVMMAAPAQAGLSKAQLATVRVDAKPDAQLPLPLAFTDEHGNATTLGKAIDGKPSLVIFADFTCRNICGPVLAFAAGGLEKSGLTPNKDFRVVSIGLDPKDTLAQARAMKQSRIGDGALADATVMLTGGDNAVRAATKAAGYHFVYDKENDQFAHPAIAFVVTGEGHITRELSGLGLSGSDLRLALVEAGQGKVGGIADRIRLLCYGFDAATGIYSASIGRIMSGLCIATIVLLAGFIALLALRARRRAGA
ncbi:MAG TPA: SCO family protein [Pseudolabrys sp.]|nr:SCO family protein [Pseudolabrys sp.]